MNRLNQVLLAIAVFCVAAWYGVFVGFLDLSAPDREILIEEDSSAEIPLETNGLKKSDVEVSITRQPLNGTVLINGNSVSYQPEKDFSGEDSFRYRFRKGERVGSAGTVTITIKPVNDPPIAGSHAIEMLEDEERSIVLNATDSDNLQLDFTITEHPENGKLSGNPPALSYVPNPDFSGKDQFRFKASDGIASSNEAIVSIRVAAVNDPPTVENPRISTYRNTPVTFYLKGRDPEGDAIRFRITDYPDHGRIRRKNGDWLYIPYKRYLGKDSVSYIGSDGSSDSLPGRIGIDVREIKQYEDLGKALGKFVKHGGIAIGDHDHPDYVFQAGKYPPASILKIVTAAAALDLLGADYRFRTEIYLDEERNLFFKGFGDPTLSSKHLHSIAEDFVAEDLFSRPFKRLVIDRNTFSHDLQVDGRADSFHYYNAPPSALPIDQNLVTLVIHGDRSIEIDDYYTPITDLILQRARQFPAGTQHFSVAYTPRESLEYSAEVITAVFKEYGAQFEKSYELGVVPPGIKPVLVHESDTTLKFVVKRMLRESDNFTANQLLLVMAKHVNGDGADIEQGSRILARFLREKIGLKRNQFNLVEGSGLSLKNNLSLMAMLKIVNYFDKNKELLPPLSASKYPDLASIGRRWKILAKSGTLHNVATLAGFMQLRNKEWKPFVIMLEQDYEMRGQVMSILGEYLNS